VNIGKPEDALLYRPFNQWQPIETAPKDGTYVLVFRMDCGVTPIVHVAFYNSEKDWGEFGFMTGETKEDYIGWWSYTRSSVTQEKLDDHWTPTHWMPLPEPPKGEGL
jgi:hypothetical protein